ncbi:MAG: hypothetical protein QXW05_01685 [Ignisphaera sp.]
MDQSLLVLLPPLVLFAVSLFVIAKKYRGYVEEDHLGEIRLVSPALKLVKNIVKKSFISVEMLLIFLTLYVSAFNSSYATTFSFSSYSLDIKTDFNLLAVSDTIVPTDILDKIGHKYVTVIQVFTPLQIDEKNFYVLLIRCSIDYYSNSNNRLFTILLDYCVNEDTVLIDRNSGISEKSVTKLLGNNITITKVDMTPLINVELIPGVYVVHSIGTIGGLSLKIEDPEKLIIIPFTRITIENICSRYCSSKTVIIGFDDYNVYRDIFDELVARFNYVVLKEPTQPGVRVYSRSYVPTVKSIISLVISFVISVIMVYTVSGGLVEKLIDMGHTLFIEGITKELFIAIATLGILLTVMSMFLPILILSSLGILKTLAIVTYLISSITSTYIITSQLSSRIGKYKPQNISSTFSYIVDRYVPNNVLVECFKSFLINDDFFNIDEIESVVEESYYMIRIELIYRRALTTVSSVEIYVERIDHGVKYTVIVDVWSVEDLTNRTLSSIQRLALSKVVGGVISCIES